MSAPHTSSLEQASELVEELRMQGKSQIKKAELLKRIADVLQPYIKLICVPVSLKWGMSVSGDGYTAFSPESKFSIKQLSSGEAVMVVIFRHVSVH